MLIEKCFRNDARYEFSLNLSKPDSLNTFRRQRGLRGNGFVHASERANE